MESALLDRIVEPIADCLTEESARKIVALRADSVTQAKADELAGKANRGELTEAERRAYDEILAAFHFVTILQARARQVLSGN